MRFTHSETILSEQAFVIKDIDGDGKKDLLIHVLYNNNTIKSIAGSTDTINHKTIMQHLIPKHEIPQQ